MLFNFTSHQPGPLTLAVKMARLSNPWVKHILNCTQTKHFWRTSPINEKRLVFFTYWTFSQGKFFK